jgi:hypothetical protein
MRKTKHETSQGATICKNNIHLAGGGLVPTRIQHFAGQADLHQIKCRRRRSCKQILAGRFEIFDYVACAVGVIMLSASPVPRSLFWLFRHSEIGIQSPQLALLHLFPPSSISHGGCNPSRSLWPTTRPLLPNHGVLIVFD